MPRVTVVVPTITLTEPVLSEIVLAHNPHAGSLHRTLRGLYAQTLPIARQVTLLAENVSIRFPTVESFAECARQFCTSARTLAGVYCDASELDLPRCQFLFG